MPVAVFVAAWITFRPDPRLTWVLAMPFFVLAFIAIFSTSETIIKSCVD